MSAGTPRPILIDTSAWIEVLRNRADTGLRRSVESALNDNCAAMTGPVWMELYRGVRGKREKESLVALRNLCQWLPFDEECWEHAALMARACRERGLNIPTGDILIAACAARHGAEIIDKDKHFGMIAAANRT